MTGWVEKACIAIGLCTPFTQWEFQVHYPDGTGRATRVADKPACLHEWKKAKADPREKHATRMRCVPPWVEGDDRAL